MYNYALEENHTILTIVQEFLPILNNYSKSHQYYNMILKQTGKP